VILVSKDQHLFSLSAEAVPVARVRAGQSVRLETADCFAGQIGAPGEAPAAVDWARINPATGPVFVEGAEPGDVLSVLVERIEVAPTGVMAVSPEFGVLRERIPATCFEVVPIEGGLALLPGGLAVPIRPMIGVIGVAPAGVPVPCGSAGPHGGNMDTRLIAEGAVVYLPVAAPGALLAAGDLHAVMGDGEICGTGVEVAGRVTLRVDVRRDLQLVNPVVETTEVATRDMADLMMRRLGLSAAAATMLMSAAGQLQISQVVDPLKTARFALPKSIIAQLGHDLL
jgi:amidase